MRLREHDCIPPTWFGTAVLEWDGRWPPIEERIAWLRFPSYRYRASPGWIDRRTAPLWKEQLTFLYLGRRGMQFVWIRK